MKTAICLASGQLTMSSQEIADLTDKEHDNVRRDIKNLAETLSLSFEEKAEPSTGGRPSKVFLLPKRETLILVSGYSVELRARIIDRWQELESDAADPMKALSNPATLRTVLLGYTEKVIELESHLAAAAPKVEAFHRIALADGSMCITNAAKHLQVQPKALFRYLQEHRWIFRRPGGSCFIGYQSRVQVGYLEHKVATVERSDGSSKATEQVRVTAKGLAKLAEMLATKEVA